MSDTDRARKVVIASFLGWTLDAFDFFIMVFVFSDVAKEFGVSLTAVTVAVTLTLAMRALGAFIFGRLADRFGRRPLLMISVLCYSVLELAVRPRADPDHFPRAARAVRHRHGRRVGHRQFADDGNHSSEMARLGLRPAAIRLSRRLFPRHHLASMWSIRWSAGAACS